MHRRAQAYLVRRSHHGTIENIMGLMMQGNANSHDFAGFGYCFEYRGCDTF
jgi:hypothetical protein